MLSLTRRNLVLGLGSTSAAACLPVAATLRADGAATAALGPEKAPPSRSTGLFVGGPRGAWRVDRITAIAGPALPAVPFLDVLTGAVPDGAAWALRGVSSHGRYTTRAEKASLDAVSPPLGRLEATRAVLIPIRKTEAWWAMTQDERRAVLEERSHHIAASLKYLPRVARKLYHCRDLGEVFDFLTWFEFDAQHEAAFDELLAMLRASEEWRHVDREVEVRVTRAAPG